jgi:hypothetical protein
VEGNPINFVDPSGHCKTPEAQDQACWTRLRQIEATYPFIDLQTGLNSTNFWYDVELIVFSLDLDRLDQAFAIDLNQKFAAKEVRINRVRELTGWACAGYRNGDKSIEIYDDNFSDIRCGTQEIVAHELAHYWDYRDNLADPFMEYVGNWYFLWWWYILCEDQAPPNYGNGNPPNAHEDFAQSLAEYVQIYTGFSTSDVGIKKGEKRWKFIENLLNTGGVLSPPP